MDETDLNNLLDCAVEAVKTAGQHALDNYSRREEISTLEKDDIKLLLDLECQEKIFDVIKSAFPKHEIFGEEGNAQETGSDYRWIVDPIDGTVNFSHGLPLWCSSVAVQLNGNTLAGAIYAPMLDQCYTATTVTKSMCNEHLIKTSDTDRLDEALILSGFPKMMKHSKSSQKLFDTLLATTQRMRIYGAAALDLCFVASGGADAYLERGIYIWDIAAGRLLIEQAGGETKICKELENGKLSFLGSNPHLFEQLKELDTETVVDPTLQ